MMTGAKTKPKVTVIGGGLAGMAAALVAAEQGFSVELFEQAKSLGGRASSLVDMETGETIDYGQHVAMGCCTQLLDFCRHLGVLDGFTRYRRLHFIAPDGLQYDIAPSHRLPSPFHLLPCLVQLKFLTWQERWGIARGLLQLVRQPSNISPPKDSDENLALESDNETIGAWLRRHQQSDRVIEQFWSLVLVSALSDTVEYASLAAARKVFADGFLAPRGASDLLVPRWPLHELFHCRAMERLAKLDVQVHLSARITHLHGDGRGVAFLELADGTKNPIDIAIVAVPWRSIRLLLSGELASALPALKRVEAMKSAAITTVHLWFDRAITPLPHAAWVGRLGQWFFASPTSAESTGMHHVQVVISASHRLVNESIDWLREKILEELQSIWPEAKTARLLHHRVIQQPAAVFSMQPGVELLRPAQATPVNNLFLAGDWTSTGWPATMEGAVRSGRLAVESLLKKMAGQANADPESPNISNQGP